jgi:hypothetical protein
MQKTSELLAQATVSRFRFKPVTVHKKDSSSISAYPDIQGVSFAEAMGIDSLLLKGNF